MLGKVTTDTSVDPTASLVRSPIKKFTNHPNIYAVLLKLPVILSHEESSLALLSIVGTLRWATESVAINLLITKVTHSYDKPDNIL